MATNREKSLPTDEENQQLDISDQSTIEIVETLNPSDFAQFTPPQNNEQDLPPLQRQPSVNISNNGNRRFFGSHGRGQLLQNLNPQNIPLQQDDFQQLEENFQPMKRETPILFPSDSQEEKMEMAETSQRPEASASVKPKPEQQQINYPQIFLHFIGQSTQRIRHLALQDLLEHSKLKFFIQIL